MSRLLFEAATRIASRSASHAIWDIANQVHQSVSSVPKTPTSTLVVMLMHITVQIAQHKLSHLVALSASRAASSGDLAMKATLTYTIHGVQTA